MESIYIAKNLIRVKGLTSEKTKRIQSICDGEVEIMVQNQTGFEEIIPTSPNVDIVSLALDMGEEFGILVRKDPDINFSNYFQYPYFVRR